MASIGTHLGGVEGLVKPQLAMHEASDLGREQALRCVGLVARLLHAGLQLRDVLQRNKGEHAQELDDLSVPHARQQVLIELEGRHLLCTAAATRSVPVFTCLRYPACSMPQ